MTFIKWFVKALFHPNKYYVSCLLFFAETLTMMIGLIETGSLWFLLMFPLIVFTLFYNYYVFMGYDK